MLCNQIQKIYNIYSERYPSMKQIIPPNFLDLVKKERIVNFHPVFLHCNLSRDNIILEPNDNITFIGWDACKIGDPCYDIAVHFYRSVYNSLQQKLFLRAYIGTEYQSHLQQIYKYLKLERIKSAIVNFMKIGIKIQKNHENSDIQNLLLNQYYHIYLNACSLWGQKNFSRVKIQDCLVYTYPFSLY